MSTQYFVILFFGISPGELFIVMLVVLILFGPRKIPEIAKTLGRGLNDLKKAQRDLNTEIHNYTGDIEKEANNIRSEVETSMDTRSKRRSSKTGDDKKEDLSQDDDEKDNDSCQKGLDNNGSDDNDDDLDDLPYPYNKNLKA